MKYLFLLSLTIFCFSCQKKPYAFVQKSTQDSYTSKPQTASINGLEKPTVLLTASTNELLDDDFMQTETLVSSNEVFVESSSVDTKQLEDRPSKLKNSIAINSFQASKPFNTKLQKRLQFLNNRLGNVKKGISQDDEAKYQKKGKTAGILGIISIGLVIIAFLGLTATASTSLLLFVPAFFIGVVGGLMGLSANKHLKSNKSTMASIGVAVGVLFTLLLIALIILATQFSLA